MRQYILELKSGSKIINKWKLEKSKNLIIGRNEQADIIINSPSLSRKHCKIMVTSTGSISLQDLESANGTFVDGKQIFQNQVVILRKGTQITLGEMKEVLVINEIKIDSDNEDSDEAINQNVSTNKNNAEKYQRSNHSRSRSREKSETKVESGKHREQEKKSPKTEPYKLHPKVENNAEDKLNSQSNTKNSSTAQNIDQKRANLWNSNNDSTLKKWETLAAETEDQAKFLKLLGVKNVDQHLQNRQENPLNNINNSRKEIVLNPKAKEQMNQDLEKQFELGMKRRDGRKNGLGM